MNKNPKSYLRNPNALSWNLKTTVRSNSPSPTRRDTNIKPLIRACGCAHRFLPTSMEEKNTSYKRRSRSCTPIGRIWKKTDISSPSCKLNLKNQKDNQSLTRHISENNLHENRVIEIKEVFEFTPNCRCDSLESRAVPYTYTTTVYVDLDSSTKRYVEEISFQICAVSATEPDSPAWKQTYSSNNMNTTVKQTFTTDHSITGNGVAQKIKEFEKKKMPWNR